MSLIKRAFIELAVKDLGRLNGTEFEYFCKPIFELIVGESCIHKGHNLLAKPVSRATDFADNKFSIVGQCGTDNNYFDVFSGTDIEEIYKLKLENAKPISDIRSAQKNCPQATKIIIFANQEAKAGRLGNLDKVINHLKIAEEIVIIDAENLANRLHDNISNQKLSRALLEYLPSARNLYTAISSTNELPSLPNHYIERDDEAAICHRIKTNTLTLLHGISGIGKSKTAQSVAHKTKSDFESVIYIELTDGLKFDFKSVKLGDFDRNLNLQNLCLAHKTLVILDNFQGDLRALKEEFLSFAKNGSKLLVTALQMLASPEDSFQINELTSTESIKILEQYKDLTPETCKRIILKVGGYPLGLHLVAQTLSEECATEQDKEQMLAELEKISDEYVPEKNRSIAEIVIGTYKNRFRQEFCLISLLNTTVISNYAITNGSSSQSLRNLTRSSLIFRAGSLYSTLHSIVLLAIRNISFEESEFKATADKIRDTLFIDNEFKSIDYYNFCVLHQEFLYRHLSNSSDDLAKKVFLYAIIQTTDNSADNARLIQEIDNLDLTQHNQADLLLLIERLELKLRSIDRSTDQDSYDALAVMAIDQLSKIDISKLPSNLQLLVRHHEAKIIFWRRDYAVAEEKFVAILKDFPGSEQCLLQLARIASIRRDTTSVLDYIDEAFAVGNQKMSHSVVMSFYELLSDSAYATGRQKHIDDQLVQFLSSIASTLHSSFYYPYQVLSKLSSHLSFTYPSDFESLCTKLPTPDNADANPKLMKAYAAIQFSLYKTYKYKNRDKPELTLASATLAERYFLEAGQKNDYERLAFVKFYEEIGAFEKADEILKKIEDKEVFYLQMLAKVKLGLGEHGEGLTAIDTALLKEQNAKGRSWVLSSFLNDKAELLRASDDPTHIIILREAITMQPTAKTKKSWERKLSKWQQN